MRKRISALFLTICMVLTLLPAQALAEEPFPEETLPTEEALPAENVLPAEDAPPTEEDVSPAEDAPPTEEDVSPAEDVPTTEELPEVVLAAEAVSSGTCGDDMTWTLDEDGTLTISGTGFMGGFSVLDTAPWHSKCTSVKTVIITPGVTSIRGKAFEDCRNLTSITIPDSVKAIGNLAFQYCSQLESIRIPDSMTSIGNEAFKNSGLTSITIPNNIVYIGGSAFENCRNLTSLTIPDSVKTISGAFKGCSNLRSITLPNSGTVIEGLTFQDCSSLESVIIPDGAKSIGRFTFSGCTNLTSVTIPDSVTSIKEGAFKNCSNLENIVIPSGVTSIESSAFESCSKLKNIMLPDGLDVINYRTFYHCSSLTDVTIPDSVLIIGGGAFCSCKGLTSITIPSGVKSIGIEAFAQCEGVTSLTLPDSGVSLNEKAFSACSGLTSLTIPGKMSSVGTSAFRSCRGLTSVTLEDGVRVIGGSAFLGCYNLTEVTFPDSLTSIGESAFSSCDKLAGPLNIPESVQYIGKSAFSGCGSLTGSVTIPGAVKQNLGESAFRDCRNLESVVLEEGVTSIGNYTFRGCDQLSKVTIPGSVTSIHKNAFYWVNNLADIYYAGTREEWESLIAASGFTPPEKAKIHFSTGEVDFNITLDPNYGSVSPKMIAVSAGNPYGELPTPTRYGYIFDGWFTAMEDGEQIFPETIVSEDAGQTLYAHWTDVSSLNWLEKLTYHFGNSSRAFGYPEGYKIPYARYVTIFGDTPRAKQLYENSEAWGGSCFGMSSTSSMFSQEDSGVSVDAFKYTAVRPYDLDVSDTNTVWNLTLRDFIETMQVAQKCERIHANYGNGCGIDEWCRQVEAFQESQKNPPVIAIWGTGGGHAMVAYDLVDISETESHLMVYDPNYPNTERYIRLDKSNGAYTGWYYHLNDSFHWGTGYPHAKIACVPYSDFFETWTGKPVAYSMSGRAAALPSADEASALLIFNSDNAAIYDSRGSEAAVIENGQLQTNRSDIFQMLETDVSETGSGGKNTVLYLPPDLYTIEDRSDSAQDFTATMVHVEQSASVTTSGSSVTFAVDDSCALNYAKANGDSGSDPGTYSILLESSLLERPETDPGTFYTVTASGSLGEERVSMALEDGKLFAEAIPAEDIRVNGSPVSAEDLGDGGSLNIFAVLNSNITAALQGDGSVALSREPSGVVHVYAASYDSDGRMTELAAETLEGSTIQFSKPVAGDAWIFLLNDTYTPVSGKIQVG